MLRKIFSLLILSIAIVGIFYTYETKASGSLTLTATTDSLEVLTSAAVNTDYKCSFVDNTTTTLTPSSSNGQITTATTTTIVAAPGASTQRKISGCSIYNTSTTASQTITIKFDTSATERIIFKSVLRPGWMVHFNEESGWSTIDENGRQVISAPINTATDGRVFDFYKVGTAAERVGGMYNNLKDTGAPGAWVPGTPGLNGDALSCDTSADAVIAGAHVLPDPASGGWYLNQIGMTASVVQLLYVADLLWYNTGINVTTTTEQAITHPGIPSRDLNGSTNGEGVRVALLATGAIGGGAVTNTTLNYTDQNGTAANTATMASWNATSVVGTVVQFQLAAGDRGVRSVQGITLGTTYTSGSLSLIQYRPIVALPITVANVGGSLGTSSIFQDPGTRVWNDSCLFLQSVVTATTLANISGTITLVER